jgi:hypothetical protein
VAPKNPIRLIKRELTSPVATPLWGVLTTAYVNPLVTAHSAVATAPGIYEMAFRLEVWNLASEILLKLEFAWNLGFGIWTL